MNDLYQDMILHHNKHPQNFRKLEDATHEKEGLNPVCGDHLFVYLKINKSSNTIEEITFTGEGCAISKASMSLLTTRLKGKSLQEAQEVLQQYQDLLTKKNCDLDTLPLLGKLKVFSGIWQYPARVKCAGLGLHTTKSILDNNSTDNIIKTE